MFGTFTILTCVTHHTNAKIAKPHIHIKGCDGKTAPAQYSISASALSNFCVFSRLAFQTELSEHYYIIMLCCYVTACYRMLRSANVRHTRLFTRQLCVIVIRDKQAFEKMEAEFFFFPVVDLLAEFACP